MTNPTNHPGRHPRVLCAICNRRVTPRKYPDCGDRLFLPHHITKAKTICENSYSDYTPPGEGRFDRWEKAA
jgi:hypothetical protein